MVELIVQESVRPSLQASLELSSSNHNIGTHHENFESILIKTYSKLVTPSKSCETGSCSQLLALKKTSKVTSTKIYTSIENVTASRQQVCRGLQSALRVAVLM